MKDFLRIAEEIVAAHRAQYKGVYMMKGGLLGRVLSNPIAEAVTDVGAELATAGAATPFLPAINAAETTTGDVLKGDSIGKSLGQGAISGAETLGAQEVGGAVGIGQGNTAFNNALGITGDNPASLGLPDIGSTFNNVLSQLGSGASTTSAGVSDGTTSPDVQGATSSAPTVSSSSLSTGPASGVTPQDGSLFNPNNPNAGTPGLPVGSSTQTFPTPQSAASATQPTLVNADAALTGNTPTSPASTGGTFSNFLKGVSPLIPAAAGAGIAAIKGNQAAPQTSALQGLQNTDTNLANTLTTAGTSGNLLPGQEATLDNQLQQNITQIRSQYASMGLSGSSSEQQAIAQAQQASAAQRTSLMTQLIQTGLTASGQADSVTQQLAQSQLNQDQQLQNALLALAGAGGQAAGSRGNQQIPAS
jgi:hypothetical protein